jgi:TonB family protein
MLASVPNTTQNTSPVKLGNPNSPVPVTNGRPVPTKVDLTAGMPGMNAANSGGGKAGATAVNFGSGSPTSGATKGNGVVAAIGIKNGVPGGTGTSPNHAVAPVQIATAAPPPPPSHAEIKPVTTASVPTVVYKPKPEYTAEAIKLHLEGKVSVKIRVTPSGSVEVIGVTSPLGHGLDESAVRAVQSTKFKPALDASGNPVPWEGIVSVSFQLAG